MQVFRGGRAVSRKYWIRWLTILICYTVFALVLLFLFYLDGPDAMYKNYGPPNRRFLDIVHNIIKCTVVYYFLIFWIFLPIVRLRELKTIFFKLLQLILFFALLTRYEYFIVFQTKNSAAQRQHLTFYDYMFWELGIGITISLISLLTAIVIEVRAKAKRQRELEKSKAMAELAAIKYQINPHFLFNCLSFIYTKAVGKNDEVANAVSLLSEIMRYALGKEEDQQGLVLLSTEIDHMKNVIQMNQMRFNDDLKIRFLENIDNLNVRIPPLVLITLVENAFKHGDLSDKDHPLEIKMEAVKGKLCFFIRNKKKKGLKELSSGIGLVNVRQRLQLIYGARHNFQVREDQQFYVAELTLTYKNDQMHNR